jgi:hypothetical protein
MNTAEAEYIRNLKSENIALKLEVEKLREFGSTKWIPVTERLPEFGQKVLCFGHEMAMNPQMGGCYVFICSRLELLKERHNKHLNSQLDENGFKRATVTHWMPLPNKPDSVMGKGA